MPARLSLLLRALLVVLLLGAAAAAGKGEDCVSHRDCDREAGMFCSDPKKPGVEVNSCTKGYCKCVEGEPTVPVAAKKEL
mmetsp:Transcript_5564/g.11310  ORF Transcript_5564/g.11310 Transcript_5564/m.11310 type:complete len:80 (+) Transcript_5564:2-241(+)